MKFQGLANVLSLFDPSQFIHRDIRKTRTIRQYNLLEKQLVAVVCRPIEGITVLNVPRGILLHRKYSTEVVIAVPDRVR